MMLSVAVIVNSGPEIKNRCTDIPEMCSIAAAIAKSGPEIGNHCSAIVPSSRIARLRSRCRNDAASDSIFLRRKVELPACCFAVVAGKNGPPAALWFSQGRIARLQLYRCRKEELPACRMTVAGAGGDRCRSTWSVSVPIPCRPTRSAPVQSPRRLLQQVWQYCAFFCNFATLVGDIQE